jgi:MFS family permease
MAQVCHRERTIALLTLLVFGPILGGFATQYLSWRWANWIVMMLAGLAIFLLSMMRETYAPVLLQRKAHKRRQETNDPRWWCRYDEKRSLVTMLRINLSRPFIMAATEPICIFWNFYISIVYGILYLCFVAYPIVFTQIRGWNTSLTGLSFLGTGIGALVAIAIEPLCRKLIQAHKQDPETGQPPLEASMSIVCIAAIAVPAGQLWFAWTDAPPVHWIWPILAGLPFGFGNILIFIYATNYLVTSYGIYGASASAGNTVTRSILGATLPLAGPAMYSALGPNWAASLCGFLLVAIIPIPFLFYKYGAKFRERSTLIRELKEDQQRLEGKRNRVQVTTGTIEVDVEKGGL